MAATSEAFEAVMEALGTCEQTLLESAETMNTCARTCATEMGEDDLSGNAEGKVVELVSKLRNLSNDMARLRIEMSRKRAELKRIEAQSRQWQD